MGYTIAQVDAFIEAGRRRERRRLADLAMILRGAQGLDGELFAQVLAELEKGELMGEKFTIRILGDSRQFSRTVGGVKNQLAGFKRAVFSVQGALAGLGAGLTLGAIVKATEKQAQAVRQVEQRIKSTGAAAGKTAKELQTYASELQKATKYGDESILEMQSVLLTFTGIAGAQFDGATRAVLDMSTALGTSLQSSALQVGKALNDPVQGISALTRAGIQFTDAQKDLIKSLVATGQKAKAQQVILAELETQFGGAAEAATETLGGALAQLSNAFGDLLEAPDGSGGMNGAIDATRELTALLQSPGVVSAFQSITSAVISLTSAVVKSVVELTNFAKGIGEIAAGASGLGVEYDRLDKQLKPLAARLDELNNSPYRFFWDADEVAAERKEISAEIAIINREMGELTYGAPAGGAGAAPVAPVVAPVAPGAGGAAGPSGFAAALGQATGRQAGALEAMRESVKRTTETVRASIPPQKEMTETLEATTGALVGIEIAAEETAPVLNQFAVQGARNIQGALADFLYRPFDQGLEGMVAGFGDALNRMAAEAVAAQIGKKMFGDYGSGGGFGGIVGKGLEFLAGVLHSGGVVGDGGPMRRVPALAFAGAPRYHGGGLAGGEVPAVLKRGEEVLTRGDPRHRLNGGGVSVVNNFTMQGDASPATQDQIAARVGDSVARAMRRNR